MDWIGPSRGFVDPVKEITATILALQNRLMTYGEGMGQKRAGTSMKATPGCWRGVSSAGAARLSLSTKPGKPGKDGHDPGGRRKPKA